MRRRPWRFASARSSRKTRKLGLNQAGMSIAWGLGLKASAAGTTLAKTRNSSRMYSFGATTISGFAEHRRAMRTRQEHEHTVARAVERKRVSAGLGRDRLDVTKRMCVDDLD